jgi:hypothetical protein
MKTNAFLSPGLEISYHRVFVFHYVSVTGQSGAAGRAPMCQFEAVTM